MDRISSATHRSPILVMYGMEPEKMNMLHASFGATTKSKALINKGVGIVGLFDRSIDKDVVRKRLREALAINKEICS